MAVADAERRLWDALNRLTEGRLLLRTKDRSRRRFARRLMGRGLEIGALFNPLPVPDGVVVRYVDRVSVEVLRAECPEFASAVPRAADIIDDAAALATVPDASEDFLIAAHVYEHMRNPVQALEAWCRVVRPGGLIYLVIPHRARTFDWRRTCTPLEHLVLDYQRPSAERDYEHFLDYAKRVHLARNPKDAIEEADRLLARDASIHYHVFEPSGFMSLLDWFSDNVCRIRVLEGPYAPQLADEFHVLLQKA
jgi:SAM-dependent methyltransferase